MDLSNGCDVLASVVEDQHIPNVLCDLGVDIVAEVAHVFKVMPPLEFSLLIHELAPLHLKLLARP
jgi:hypothetical protein